MGVRPSIDGFVPSQLSASKVRFQSGRYSASRLAQPNFSASRNAQTSSHISMGWGECPSSIIIVIVLNSRARSWSSCGIALVRASFSIRSSGIAWRRGGRPGPGSRIQAERVKRESSSARTGRRPRIARLFPRLARALFMSLLMHWWSGVHAADRLPYDAHFSHPDVMRFDAATGLGTDGGQWHMILPWAPPGKPRWRASDTVSRRPVESG